MLQVRRRQWRQTLIRRKGRETEVIARRRPHISPVTNEAVYLTQDKQKNLHALNRLPPAFPFLFVSFPPAKDGHAGVFGLEGHNGLVLRKVPVSTTA